jgi:sialate O-acetylesterase
MQRRLSLAAAVLVALAGLPAVRADVKPHSLFTDNMVLQQGKEVPVWGTADNDERVTVQLKTRDGNVSAQTNAKDGKWMLRLPSLKAGGPYELTITGKNTVTLKNVLVGEVWVCSGQSNMEWSVNASADPEKVKAGSNNPMIRLFTVPKVANPTPQSTVNGQWVECGPDTVGGFSAVGYHFGRNIQKALNVPVGLINSSWGGTAAEPWTTRAALASHPEFKGLVSGLDASLKSYPKTIDNYLTSLEKYLADARQARSEGKDVPVPPTFPVAPGRTPGAPTALYNGMIAPLQPFAIQGVIWYQGESNAGRAYAYRTLFPLMIQSWRDSWGQGDFPFLFVQLAPFMAIVNEPQESTWAELREAQLLTAQKVKNTAMAVITDVGDPNDIHPRQKAPVGERLALAARALAYGEKIVYSGPIYDSMKVEGNKAILSFKHVGGGLVVKGDRLQGFTIAGADRKFVNADAVIQENKVIVSSPKVEKPVAVRYGWANCPVVNLWNKEGLPASPFRTDDFPGLTAPKPTATGAGGQ